MESEKLEKEIHDSIVQTIKKREEKETSAGEDNFGSDFLGELIKVHHDANEKQSISVDEMVDECKTFYFAGEETTNSLLAWTVLLLALNEDSQDVARKEVLELFGKQNPTPDGISKLKYVRVKFCLKKEKKKRKTMTIVSVYPLICTLSFLFSDADEHDHQRVAKIISSSDFYVEKSGERRDIGK